ncbi:hypothetical protein P167DRAFT_335603 [Morchella conica CCBAS932]|uniref:Uncharacterized protein n=1 Tax=Morchella conica CCBAS932 TaxID=1392247 RepID=A0A3N4KDM8_9PEZI|nr:hypothetical protein P167DRAFT_335603 [Morchella conica CCBAS932]
MSRIGRVPGLLNALYVQVSLGSANHNLSLGWFLGRCRNHGLADPGPNRDVHLRRHLRHPGFMHKLFSEIGNDCTTINCFHEAKRARRLLRRLHRQK